MPAKKLVLTYVDSLRTDMLERAVAEDRAPTFAALIERGTLIGDCVSSFPSVTPVACAEMVTGAGGEGHWISGMNWYHRLERRYVEYGSSLEATRAFGIFRALYDLVYNMNLAHLNPGVETLFEQLDDAELRTACTPFLIYRGRHRHQVSLEGLLRRAVDATRLKFRHHTWGPAELFYGDLYASSEVPCKSTSIPGNRDGYSACCAAELAERRTTSTSCSSRCPTTTTTPTATARRRASSRSPRPTTASPSWSRPAAASTPSSPSTRLILLADHAQTPVHRGLPLAELLGREWTVLRPSESKPDLAQLAVSPTGRAAHVYLLPGEGERADPEAVRAALATIEGVDLICRLETDAGEPLDRKEPGPVEDGAVAVVERGETACASARRDSLVDLRGRRWQVDGELSVLEASTDGGLLQSAAYPDPLGRVWSALGSPHAGDFLLSLTPGYEAVDWGGVSHAGGGSHGSLHAGDSLGPLLFVGCGPADAEERHQWALRDVAEVVRAHFGLA